MTASRRTTVDARSLAPRSLALGSLVLRSLVLRSLVARGRYSPRRAELRSFGQILRRDVFVTTRSLPTFLAQVVLQPLFLIFVFGKVLVDLGFTQAAYADLLLPGTIALTAVLTGLQGTALPLVIEFSYTKEIEDRLLAPLPTGWVAFEKILFGALRALAAALVMFPVGWWVLGKVPISVGRLPLLAVVLVVGCLLGGAIGLSLGTLVEPNQINIAFALVLTPLLFTGCAQYPWPSLSVLRWFQTVTLFNPLTYVSEGMRASMVPTAPHMNVAVAVAAAVAATAGFSWLGIWGFRRRALE